MSYLYLITYTTGVSLHLNDTTVTTTSVFAAYFSAYLLTGLYSSTLTVFQAKACDRSITERGRRTDSGMTVAEETAVDAADNRVEDVDQASATDLRLRTI